MTLNAPLYNETEMSELPPTPTPRGRLSLTEEVASASHDCIFRRAACSPFRTPRGPINNARAKERSGERHREPDCQGLAPVGPQQSLAMGVRWSGGGQRMVSDL